MSYLHPYQDVDFVLRKVVDFDALCAAAGHDEINADLAATILSEAGRLGSEVLAPLNRVGDREGAKMGAQGVEESPGFKDAYRQFADAGWLSLTVAEDFGGQDLPNCLGTAVNEIWHSANMAFALCPMLSQGAMEAIGHHADDALKALYLPKLATGEWTGTMNITEADAGSDLAAIKTKAKPAGDHYLITGQKLYITWGDHGMTDNIVHLVLARLPDAPPGVKGISLFIVPKFLLDAKGEPGERNAVNCLSLEHKLGIHASPTCLMDFTDAVGFLVGEPNNGLAYMFTMMNHARQSVGLQGLAISERAYQEALQYAKDRLQGTRRDGSRIPIIEFPDVRRMLMTMKSCIEAMRVLALVAAAEADRALYATDPAVAARHFARLELYTPIVKGWLTELAQELTSLGIQIDGGMGYVEEAGAAQHYRDARILPIYEGTTGIQALDFVGRKMLANHGETLLALLTEMEQTAAELRSTPYRYGSVVKAFEAAVAAGTRARQSLLDGAAADRHLAGSASVNFLMLFGYLCGGWLMVKSAQQAQTMLDAGEGDPQLLTAKLTTTRFFCEHLLPRTGACLASVLAGSESTMALTVEQL
ncbi:acyl-CoA dehydrogenase [Candidatus Thiodictyon syntrophicum]|jgi:alkylation response protein AidB-like acyl-CoA dehydrogenase|uniref:3-methylmercaptopropionyl-CoA dehydrogenase n=1 Tax=Candidatus Thiodictyon syntrophicum TaxID=1166950 RepID=A0A2K8U4V7_9GAMM|nr:acyl-CoA dehydrogenase [Candidatus Thiodictyon syntrophicum]AUB80587.1 acyl-CoA dehydrogenase [Candidatus Thiodictyon syntrophicum]